MIAPPLSRLLCMALALFAGCGESPASAVVRPIVARPSVIEPTAPPTAWVEIVADPETRERGLMGRLSLQPDCGMLFVYPGEKVRNFWMKDCFLPLSAAFLDGDARVVSIAEMAPGAGLPVEELPMYPSGGPVRYVLEMESGWFRKAGVTPGQRIDLDEALQGIVAR